MAVTSWQLGLDTPIGEPNRVLSASHANLGIINFSSGLKHKTENAMSL